MKRNVYVGVLLTALLMTSCINTKRIVYLEDMKESLSYPMNAQPEMKIQRDDRLSIVVSSRNPELTVPFNISTGGNFQVTSSGDVATGTDMQKCEKGYMVDLNGYIEFPVLGKLKVVDLSCKQVAELIKKRLIDENLINDPLVFIDILNIKITVMGEVESPQVLKIDDSRITLLEAITRTGGVTSNALLDRVFAKKGTNAECICMISVRRTFSTLLVIIYSRMTWYMYILSLQKPIRRKDVH